MVRDVPVGHPDFGKSFPCRCVKEKMQKGRPDRLQRYSNLGPLTRLTFESLLVQGRSGDPENQARFARAVAAAKAFARDPQGWLVFLGPSGCGKTHLAAAIANERLAQGHPAFFKLVADLLDHLRSTFSPGSDVSYDQLFETVKTAPFLLLDDLGPQGSTPWAREKLFQILDHRFHARLPTVVTTRASLDELDEWVRTRLTDPSLSQVLALEARESPLAQSTGI
ncbi:MAG: ATP-binding protein, partial [Chloroflexota bacterium]|nr:ATP-binding protein [Chloroflexota bacterium]